MIKIILIVIILISIIINVLNKNYFNRTTEELEKSDWVFKIKDQRSTFKNSLKYTLLNYPNLKNMDKVTLKKWRINTHGFFF